MAAMYCALCRRPVEARRHVGPGTVCVAVLTGGLWLFAIPFYPKRCAICKSSAVTETAPGDAAAGEAGPSRVDELERRLSLAEAELETARVQLDRLISERDFYHQLLGDPAARAKRLAGE